VQIHLNPHLGEKTAQTSYRLNTSEFREDWKTSYKSFSII